MRLKLVFIILSIALFACDEKTQEQLSEMSVKAKDVVEEGVKKAKEELPGHKEISDLTEEQLNQFLGWEYKIIDYQTPPSGGELEAKLNSLGSERWECVALAGVNVAIRVQCKRPTRHYLRKALSSIF